MVCTQPTVRGILFGLAWGNPGSFFGLTEIASRIAGLCTNPYIVALVSICHDTLNSLGIITDGSLTWYTGVTWTLL